MKSQVLSCVALCGAMYSLPHSLNASSLITESAVSSEKNLKPNIILITTDQQSYNTISALAKFNRESGFFSTSNIKYIDNQLVTVIKIQMICKCKYKTI